VTVSFREGSRSDPDHTDATYLVDKELARPFGVFSQRCAVDDCPSSGTSPLTSAILYFRCI
jgi:hypothetical protein